MKKKKLFLRAELSYFTYISLGRFHIILRAGNAVLVFAFCLSSEKKKDKKKDCSTFLNNVVHHFSLFQYYYLAIVVYITTIVRYILL